MMFGKKNTTAPNVFHLLLASPHLIFNTFPWCHLFFFSRRIYPPLNHFPFNSGISFKLRSSGLNFNFKLVLFRLALCRVFMLPKCNSVWKPRISWQVVCSFTSASSRAPSVTNTVEWSILSIAAKIIATWTDKKFRGAQIDHHVFIERMTNCGAL